MSTGILMRSGAVEVSGNAGANTGALLQGGRIVVHASTGDFSGVEMRGGDIIVKDDAGSFACARMKGGAVYAKTGKPVPPARDQVPDGREQAMIANDQMRLQGLAMAQAAEDRLQRHRELERAKAESAARMALYRSSFE